MKRIWFAIVFLIIAALACVFEQCEIKNFCTELDRETETAISCLNENDKEGFEHSAERIKRLWSEKNDLLFALSGHVILDELSFRINAIDSRPETVYEIQAVNRAYFENSKIKPSNIL